jgi:putative ABC transport system permease protein
MSWLTRALRRRKVEAQLDAELRDHIERQVADLRRAGLSEAEARRRTAHGFGGVEQIAEACRDARGTRWLHELMQDIRYGLRLLRRSPSFTLVVVTSLALGIGANTAIFTLVDGLLVRNLPVRDPQQLALLDRGSWTNPIWEQIRDRRQGLAAGAFAWSDDRFDLSSGGEAAPVDGFLASGELFDVLGVPAILGRTLTAADDRRGAPDGPVAVISHRLWQQRYGGAVGVIGRTIALNRVPFTIVGVTPPEFLGPTVGRAFDVAIPLATIDLLRPGARSQLDSRSTWWLEIMFRLRPGQTVDEATRALRGVQPQIRDATLPAGWPQDQLDRYLRDAITLSPAANGVSYLRTRYQRPLLTLMVTVGLVLLIACANVANLLLARAAARRHELAARLALGASRARVARQLLTESLLFAVPGAVLGTWVASWASRLLVDQISTPGQPVALDLALNWRVLGFTVVVAIATALLFGVTPAWRAARVDPHDALGAQGRGSLGDRRRAMSNSLVVVQVALSLVLIVGAGLFVRSFATLSSLDLGLDTGHVLSVGVDATKSAEDPGQRRLLFERLVAAASAVPGAAGATLSLVPPMSGMGWNDMFEMPGQPRSDRFDRNRLAFLNAVTPRFFETYGTAIRAGRDFDVRDRAGALPVAIVNEAFAKKFLKGPSRLGQFVLPSGRPNQPQEQWEVVGIVEDAAYSAVRPPYPPTVYRPLAQLPADQVFTSAAIGIRSTSVSSASLTRDAVSSLVRVDPTLSLTVLPFERQVRSLLRQERLVALLSASFGALALLLACVGLYGVTAYAVSRRRTEIGIRMALGADAPRVVRLVLGRAALLIGAGVVIGGALSLWAVRFIGSLLFGLEPRDPATFVGAAVALSLIGALAAWLPARRASHIDPARVLREG